MTASSFREEKAHKKELSCSLGNRTQLNLQQKKAVKAILSVTRRPQPLLILRKMNFCQKSREGGVRKGGVAQICLPCAKLPVFCFVHQMKGAQNCRKFVANLKLHFGQFYANTLFQRPLLQISENSTLGSCF